MKEREPCIEWGKSRMANGYGRAWSRDRVTTAHRAAWEAQHGPIPDGLDVCHSCDNRGCVNLAHLFLGTRTDNMRDAVAKGRQARGEKNGQARLTEPVVLEARGLYATGRHSQRSLARRFGVQQATMRAALLGRTWRHVAGA